MNGEHIEKIFKQYSAVLYKVSSVMLGNAADASDAVQETFLKYMTANKKFQTNEHEKAWLIRVNINICKNMLRFHRRHPAEAYESLAASPHSLEENRIMDILMALRSKEKEVLILHYIEGYSCREIGQILGKTENWARVTSHGAKQKIRSELP